MSIEELLKESEEAFHKMDWPRVLEVNKEILEQNPSGATRELSRGFYHYALAKLDKDPKSVIDNLTKARSHFKRVDDELATFSKIEKLILLSEIEPEKRGEHLRNLGDFIHRWFSRKGDPSYLPLAIEAYESARDYFKGEDYFRVNINLTYCYGSYAPYSEDPEKILDKMISLCVELEKSLKGGNQLNLARVKMNRAMGYQHLAALKESNEHIRQAISLAEEAILIFEEKSPSEAVRARRILANLLRDASIYDSDNVRYYLERIIEIKDRLSQKFLKMRFDIDHAFEELDIGVTYLEIASYENDPAELIEEAFKHLGEAAQIFERERYEEELALTKQSIATAHRMRFSTTREYSYLEKAIDTYNEAIEVLEEGNPLLLGKIKSSLAGAYKEASKFEEDKKEEYLRRADILSREAEELLKER
jgi:tetratricopeptide (TPR) repeat protein